MVDIYGDPTFPVRYFADVYFGGFNNSVFYDIAVLLCLLTFVFFCFKILGIFFRRRGA